MPWQRTGIKMFTFYLAVVDKEDFDFDDYIFNTEADPFKRSHFNTEKAKVFLGIYDN